MASEQELRAVRSPELRALDELTTKVAEKIAELRDARHKGEDVRLEDAFALIDGLRDELSTEAIEIWKRETKEQWKEIAQPKPVAQPAQRWVNGRRMPMLRLVPDPVPTPEPQQKAPGSDVGPSKIGEAQNVLGQEEARKEKAAPEAKSKSELVRIGSTALALKPQPLVSVEPEVAEINEKHAVISNLGGKCVVMEWVPSVITSGGRELAYQSFTSFKERYQNRYVAIGHRDHASLGPYWLSHPQRRQYEGLDLVPNGEPVLPGNYLNLWRGWGVDPRKGSWRLIERHIVEVLANGNQKFEDYIKKSTAWKFQNPALPTEVVLALLGGKGAGKGAWGLVLMLIFGQHALQIFSSDHLCGKHNAHLQNKLFLFLDEAVWAGDKDAERVLKGVTTEKWIMIEPKGVNAFQWVNRLGLYMSGNDKWIVPASHDERRYAVNKINERWKQNPDYFGPLFAEINNGGPQAMLYDMLRMDLDGWHPRDHVPQTKALIEQKLLGLTGLEQWYVHLLNVGELPHPDKKNPRFVLSEYLIEDAKTHNARNRYVTKDELGRFMSEMGCQHKSNGKKWGWIFPPLLEARSDWAQRAGKDWEWLANIEDWGEKPV